MTEVMKFLALLTSEVSFFQKSFAPVDKLKTVNMQP